MGFTSRLARQQVMGFRIGEPYNRSWVSEVGEPDNRSWVSEVGEPDNRS